MNKLKSHLRWYTKSQRSGVFVLLLIIILVQIAYYFIDFKTDEVLDINSQEIIGFQKQIDSLKQVEIENKKPKIYPFNPNFITDFKGYQLGMTTQEIDRLHQFRKQNKWINSSKQFQQVTKISDSLYLKISPYFKFPKWVIRKNKEARAKSEKARTKIQERKISTNDINKATAEDLKTINGIGEKLSERIIKYRTKLQGFTYENQLYEVWGLDKEVVEKVLKTFKVIEKPTIKKVNVNTATFKEVLHTPYVDYELCKKIFNYRDEVAELQNITELKNIEGFPLDKYEKIVLYLEAK